MPQLSESFRPHVTATPAAQSKTHRFDVQEGLSQPEFEQFAHQGYLALPGFCIEPELTQLHHILATLFREKIGHEEGRQFDMLGLDNDVNAMTQPQILNPSQFVPLLLRTDHFRKVSAIARQLLGPHAQFSFDHSILKPAGSRAATPWHQDEAHHANSLFRYRQISFWMALQDTPAESGCMRYVPRSHQGKVLPHQTLNHDPRVHAMECEPGSFDESLAVIEPAEAGTCILHDGRTLHAALPNTSAHNRMAYIIAFTGPPLLRTDSPAAPVGVAAPPRTANLERRARWLMRGGLLTALKRRMRMGLRSQPVVLWLKMRLLLKALLVNKRQHTE